MKSFLIIILFFTFVFLYLLQNTSISAASLPAENRYAVIKNKKITFAKEIAPFMFKTCTPCHREGQVAPFPLITYEDARKHSQEILTVTSNHQMPPWKAKAGYGKFVGERRLTDADINMLKGWVATGMEFGEQKDLPPQPKFKDAWQLGTPDLIVKAHQITIPASGPDFFRTFIIPLNLPEDKYVRAMDILPSNRKVVHHSTLFMNTDKNPGLMAEKMPRIGGWAPGGLIMPYPEGYARFLPKKTDLIVVTHLHPTGKEEVEQSQIGLYFADKPAPKQPSDLLIDSNDFTLPANAITHIEVIRTLDSDITVFGIMGHAHFICTEIKAYAILPDKKEKQLLWLPDWDFNWQEQYRYETPFVLPKGTRIIADFIFDNTANNIHNPNSPPIPIQNGENSTDEMANVLLNTLPK